MDTKHPHKMPMLDTARSHITALFQAFEQHTGLPRSFVATLARGEPKFGTAYLDLDFRIGSYDTVMGRMSDVWPEDLPWPAGVPRYEPVPIPDDLRADFQRRMQARAKAARA